MTEKPLKSLFDRDEACKEAQRYFSTQINLLQDLANYGSNLIARAYNSSKKALPDAVVCGVLLKQVVAMIDAVETLLASGIVHATFLPARAAFEASLYLEWILFSDTDRKAKCYLVSNLREERLWALRAISGTPEEKIFNSIVKDLDVDFHSKIPNLASDAKTHLAEVNSILARADFKSIDLEFEKLKLKRKADPQWYLLLGAKSIRQIAKAVLRLPEYEMFYAKGSRITHSASYKDHIKFSKGQVHFKPIRHLEGSDVLLNFLVSSALRTYQSVLGYYRQGELHAFAKKYVQDWRTPFLSTKRVKYNF